MNSTNQGGTAVEGIFVYMLPSLTIDYSVVRGGFLTEQKGEKITLEDTKKLAEDYKAAPVSKEVTSAFYRRSGEYFPYDYAKYSELALQLDARDEEKFKDVDLIKNGKPTEIGHTGSHRLWYQ